ncbi:hypothetical protein [Pelagibius sp.]|uniref:hypothetical protein n=1 Tax=Pelagibius sp. TaxID=1931238 RepID=UPI003BAE94D4
MKLKNTLIFALLVAGLAACATAKEQHLQDGFRVMTGEEIVSVFSGQTVEGRYSDGRGVFVEFRSADGRLTTIESDGRTYHGTWSVDGDWLCFIYTDFPVKKCVEVLTKDGRYVDIRTGGREFGKFTDITSIQPGNVNNLPLK